MATVSEAYLTLGFIAHWAIGTHHFDGNTRLCARHGGKSIDGNLRVRRAAGVLARRRSRRCHLVVRAQRGRNVDSVMGSDPLSSGRPGSSGLHLCGPALHTGRPRRPSARNSSQRLGRSGRRRGGAQTRSCGLSRWNVVEPQNILIAFGKGICHNRGVMDPYAVQSPTVTSSQPSCN